jgi:hypothetical protein
MILFGDRVQEADLNVLDCTDMSTARLQELRNYSKRAEITIMLLEIFDH